MRKIDYIVIHHSAGSPKETLQDVNHSHQVRNWGTPQKPLYCKKDKKGYFVQYHWFIDRAGNATQTRDYDEIGWQAGVWDINKRSVGICLSGNFQNELPKSQQLEALKVIIKGLRLIYPRAVIKPHRFFKATACPGKNITDSFIKSL